MASIVRERGQVDASVELTFSLFSLGPSPENGSPQLGAGLHSPVTLDVDPSQVHPEVCLLGDPRACQVSNQY